MKMHKKIIAVCLGIGLILAIGISLLTQQKDAYARDNNSHVLDSDFWLNDLPGAVDQTGFLIEAVYGDGNIGTDTTFYTDYWTTNTCDTSSLAVEYIAPGTDTLPASLSGNKIYVLENGVHVMNYPMYFDGDCTAVIAEVFGTSGSDLTYINMTGGLNTFVMSGKTNNIIAGMYVDVTSTQAISVTNTNNSTIRASNIRFTDNAMVFNDVTQMFIGGSVSDAGTGLYVNGGQNIKYGTNWPVALSRFSGTGVHVINTNNMTLDADVAGNDFIGGYFENVSDITINSRYWTENDGFGLFISGATDVSILGGSYSLNNDIGLSLQNITGLTLNNIIADSNTGHGIWVQNTVDVSGNNINAHHAAGSNIGIYLSNTDNVNLSNLNATGNGAYGLSLSQVDNFLIQDALLSENNVDGANIGRSNSGSLTNIVAANNTYGDGISLGRGTDISIEGVEASGNGEHGIGLENAQNISVNDVDLYANGSDGWHGYGLMDFELSDYMAYDNTSNGVTITEESTSGYVYSGVAHGNDMLGIAIEGGSTGVLLDTAEVYGNIYGLAVFSFATDSNTIQSIISHNNSSGGVRVYEASQNSYKDIHSYDNGGQGVYIYNAGYNTFQDIITYNNNIGVEVSSDAPMNTFVNIQSFSNTLRGIYVSTSRHNTFDYIYAYDNQIGLEMFETRGNYVNNTLMYDNDDGIVLSGSREATINNFAVFNNINGILVEDYPYMNSNIFNNGHIFNNILGISVTEPNDTQIEIHQLSIYNNNTGMLVEDSNTTNYGNLLLFANDENIAGSLGTGTASPVGRSNGSVTYITDVMTCNRAIQATNNTPGNLLFYPYCDDRGPQAWIGSLDVRYTFFPEIKKQIQPVIYDDGNLIASGSYVADMFVSDYVWQGAGPFGGHILLDESNIFTYPLGGFTYKNTTATDLAMISNQATPNYTITGVDDIGFDGVSSAINGIFAAPLLHNTSFSMVNQDGLWITRIGYEDAGSISNYYGFIRGLSTDDDVSISKTASTGVVFPGDTITFTITVTNSGSSPAGFSQVVDMLPIGIDTGTITTDPTAVYSGDRNAYIWDMPIISGNSSYVFILTGVIDQSFTGDSIVNTGLFISDTTSNGEDRVIYDEEIVTVLVPVNGACGPAEISYYGQNMLTGGNPDLCVDGTATSFVGPDIFGGYSWTCQGLNGGLSDMCTSDENRCGDTNIDTGNGEQCDDGNLDDNDGCSSQCQLEVGSCTLVATPSIGLIPLDVNFTFQGSTGFTFDYIDYGTGATGNSLNYTYFSSGLYAVTAYQSNDLSGAVVSTCTAVVRANQLSCMALGFSITPTTGTVPFVVTGSYTTMPIGFAATSLNWGDGNNISNPLLGTDYGHNYINTGVYAAQLHVENVQYSGFDLYCPIGIGASACGDTGTVDIETLEISVIKTVQNANQTIFPNGLVPYIIEVTNTSTIARLDNVTIIDLISDNMSIGSYFFEYNGTIYSGVVNDGYFVIDNTILPISLDPQESIEIIVYATMDPQAGLNGNNYAFAGGDWVPLNGDSLCTSSGSTPTCSRNPNSQAVQDVSTWSSYAALNGSFNPNNFTVCAETTQGAPTSPGSPGTPLDPSVDIEKTLVDDNGIPTTEVVVREDSTFILDIDFTNMYPHTINWNNFSLTDYFSGGIGISGWHIVDIQTASGVSVPRTTGSNEYNIDLSGLYAPNVYTPVCQTFAWTPVDHTPGCWINEPFGSSQANYVNCLPQVATDSGYQYIQRYTITGAGLNGIQFYPGVNDQWFGGSAVWSLFDTQPHTAMLCQTAPVGIVIDQIDSLQLIVTAQVTEPTLAGQGAVCNEANVSYAGTGDIDDACFNLTIPQYCALMIQPDFVIDAYDTVPYISGGYVNGSVLSDMTLTSTTTSVNPIVNYQWDIYSSGGFLGMMNSPWIFDNTLIISGQGTPSIDLNFTQYVSNADRPFIWVTLTVTDSMGYQAEYTTPLFRNHDNGGQYRVAGNVITGSSVTGYTLNMTGEMLSSATDPIIPSNELWWSDVGLVPTMAGIDRYNVGSNDEFFPYIGSYNYTNVYTPGVHTLNLNTHIGDTNQNYLLGDRTYPVACSVSCGNGIIEGVEQCDDTNTNPGDGCSNYCQIESGRQCTGQPSVCTIIPPYCGDGIPQNISGSATTGTIDYVIYGDISANTGNEVYGFMGYQSGMLFTFSGGINIGSVVSYQWALSGSDSMNPGITGFIVGSTTGPTIDIFSNAFGINGTNRQGHITLTMVDADGNTIQVQGYITAYRDGMTVVYPSVNNISIAGSTVTYSDYELHIAGSSGLFPPSGFVQHASTGWEMLFSNGGWAGYDRYEDGVYDYTQQGTPQVVQYIYNATGEYISTDITFFYSGFAMNVPANMGDLHTNYVFHTTAGQVTSGYQEQCDDGNQDEYDGCTTQCISALQCQTILVNKIDPIINYQRAYPIWTGSTGMVIQLNTPTIGDGLNYQWDITPLDLTAVYSAQFSGSSTGTVASIFVSADTLSGGSSFPDFSFQAGVTISNGLMTGYVDGIVICTQNGACGFTTYSYNFSTGNLQGFAVNGNYNFTTYMQSINQTTPTTSDSLTGVTIQNGGSTYYIAIYDTGTYLRYTGPASGSGYVLNSGTTYDTIPFQLSGGGISFNNTIGVSYYNTCLGGSYCGDGVIDYNDQETCDQGQNNGQPNSGCSNACKIASVSCNIIGFPLGGNAPLTVSLAMNPRVSGSYFDYGNGTTGTTASYTYTSGGSYNIIGYTPHPSSGSIMVACPLLQQINVYGQSCTNGATNFPTCNACGTGQTYCAASQQCIPTGSTCAGCTNGATNYPTCNQCGTGQTYCGTTQQCIASGSVCGLCTNGATNPPTCDLCGLGQSYCAASQQCITTGGICPGCTNGATNYPTCNQCGTGQTYCAASQQCIATGSVCVGCTNGATNYPTCNQCSNGYRYRNGECEKTTTGNPPVLQTDYCPAGDFSSSYYDKQCGSAPVHGSAPVGKFCIYDDEEYLSRGSFDDIFGHWGELPIEVMRVSCLHRGRHTKAGLRRYEPNGNIQRDEVLKTLVKIVGIEFEDFTIKSEELLYNGVIPFADVAYNNWFSHYASYAFSKGLTEGLYATNASKNYLSPTAWMTRYEATKAIVIAYEKIHGTILTQGASPSKITDVPATDPNYAYVRKAEVAGLVQGYPQSNGTFIFKGKGSITRAEFAKIVAAAFGEQLIDVDQVVVTSTAYNMILQSLQKVKGDKLTFVKNLFEKMKLMDDALFLQKFKVQKDLFIKTLADKVLLPMIQKQ